MTPTRHRTLGIALHEKGLLVAEARPSDKDGAVHEAARMEIPAEGLPAVGGALRAFLREHGFHARRAVVGVPARWVVSREMVVPPLDDAQLAGLLRIRAEREIAADVGNLATDYARAEGATGEGSVLLVAMLGEHLDQIKQMCREAGLKLEAVVPTVMVLAASQPAPGCHVVLSLREDGTDMAVLTGGQFRVVRDVPATDATSLTAEIRRMLAPLSGVSSTGRVTVWGQAPQGLVKDLAERLGMEVVLGAGVPSAASGAPEQQAFAGAVALAMADSNAAARPVDFTASRLTEVRKFHLGRRAVWGVVAALIALVSGVLLVVDWRLNVSALDEVNKFNQSQKADVDKAQQMLDRITAARGWYDRRPPFMECLRDLTVNYPPDGGIWSSSLLIKLDKVTTKQAGSQKPQEVEVMGGVLTGKATNSGLPLQLGSALEKSGRFKDVNSDFVRSGTGSDQTYSFAISFTYVPSE